MGGNSLLVFNGLNRIKTQLLKSTIARVEKDAELQYILLSLDGASVLFSEDKIQFINRTFESVFVKSHKFEQRPLLKVARRINHWTTC